MYDHCGPAHAAQPRPRPRTLAPGPGQGPCTDLDFSCQSSEGRSSSCIRSVPPSRTLLIYLHSLLHLLTNGTFLLRSLNLSVQDHSSFFISFFYYGFIYLNNSIPPLMLLISGFFFFTCLPAFLLTCALSVHQF